ncbi:MAG: hypothetical protein BWK78_00585 [Thiotrichaceae bacterium IS1]|nr:MAG: hypothetical protein BWK78_00585 [Thiotrichaceae bacterium IS1]
MTGGSKFSTSSPKSLITKPDFWRVNKWLIVIVTGGLCAIGFLFRRTYPTLDESLIYSLVIHFFAFWGIGVAIQTLAKIQVEHAIASDVEKKASEKLQEIRSSRSKGETDRISLEQAGREVLPDNTTLRLAMPRLVQHILTEAKDHRVSTSTVVMQPYREEAMGDIFKLQNIQKISLQLGILGTFIGLILALHQLNNTTQSIDSLLHSLGIAFGTSVAGLESAVIIGLLIMVVRQKQEAYFQMMEKATDAMISLAQNAIPDDYFFTGFEQITTAVEQLNRKLGDRTFALTEQIRIQTDEIQRGMGKLAETKTQFKEFLNQIQESQTHFVAEMMKVYDTFSPATITTQLQQSLEYTVNNISNTFNEKLSPSLEKLTVLNNAIHGLYETLQTADQKLAGQNQLLDRVNQELIQTKSNLYSSIQQLLTAQKEFIDSAVTQLEKGNQELTQSKEEFYASLQPLIASQNDTFQGFRSDIGAMSQRITTLNTELEKSNKIVQELIQIVTSKQPLYKIIFVKLKNFFKNLS